MRTNLRAAFEDEDIGGEKKTECKKHPKGEARKHVATYPDHFPEKSLFVRLSQRHRLARRGRFGRRGTHKNTGSLIPCLLGSVTISGKL